MSVASDDSAATTYVYAAERNALLAAEWLRLLVMPADDSHTRARLLASISTGNVMKLNSVVDANSTIPAKSICGKLCTVMMPMSNIHVIHDDANDTKGTSAERIFRGAYACAC